MSVNPVPAGYRTLTPYLALEGAAKAIDLYKKAFGAEELDRFADPSGQKIWHAAIKIGDSILFVSDVFPEMGSTQSKSSLWLYLGDVDAAFKRAVDAGCTARMPPADMFWGDRMASVEDPFGQKWSIAARVKQMTKEEMAAASAAVAQQAKRQQGV
jgi:PhnB protein